ncbi:MAG: DUF5615 family PIN-like protein [Chlamydiae bacterium]|nr:DUF5615 family PIN-like protein [Chlamydiota bacterium]MBI3265559.1 DUF5615 family PIN-like protein [Chlamydiota bacterium]
MIDSNVANELSQEGYDVLRVSQVGMARSDDEEIFSLAIRDKRILITLDEHFGDWAVLPLNQIHSGVIRVRVKPTSGRAIASLLIPFLDKHKQKSFNNYLVIIGVSGSRWVKTVA